VESTDKVIPFDRAASFMAELRRAGKKIIQCHGTFDLVHAGHIIHFEEAKALGDILVVTVTSDKFVNKGPGRPYFKDQIRSKCLSALACVDYVVLVPYPTATEAINCIHPHIYCKGQEYPDPDNGVTGNLREDMDAIRSVGGEIRYLGSIAFNSARLLNQHFDTHSRELKSFCRKVAAVCPPAEFRRIVEQFAGLRVLVIGDVIFDRYTTVEVQGLTSKNRIPSVRFITEETQAGGALAVFRHIREFTPNAKLISLIGTEPWVETHLRTFIAPEE